VPISAKRAYKKSTLSLRAGGWGLDELGKRESQKDFSYLKTYVCPYGQTFLALAKPLLDNTKTLCEAIT
jgi:hypothetical protein